MIAAGKVISTILNGINVQAEDILSAEKGTTILTLQNCTSQEWGLVGKAMASLNHLHTLIIQQCNTTSFLFQELVNCKSLQILHFRSS